MVRYIIDETLIPMESTNRVLENEPWVSITAGVGKRGCFLRQDSSDQSQA